MTIGDYGTGSADGERRIYGTIDPSNVGLDMATGTLYRRNDPDSSFYQLWMKTGPAVTDWERITRRSEVSSMIGSSRPVNQVLVDFGFPAGGEDTVARTTVGASWITTGSRVVVTPSGVATPDHDPDDYACEGLSAYATNLVVGTSFDLVATAPNGAWGRYLFNTRG